MRCLIVSDIHSNIEALEAVLDDAGAVDQVWCLGDVVGYGPSPNECVDRLRTLPNLICLAGNHDWAVLGKLDLRDFNPDARQASVWTRDSLSSDALAWLEARPETAVEGPFTLVHGSPRHPIWEYIIYASTAISSFRHFDTRYCLVGHTHVPVIFCERQNDNGCEVVPPSENHPLTLGETRLIINPGSVGQPRDGDERASYVLLDLETLTLEHRRVDYPIQSTQDRMAEAGLPSRLILRLGYGW
jgi:predicted phosphodiesterase